ncbi:beta strand repeat-containing protein [Anatilimnocola floriformis]|uniref:beta strand repeat-containing protein n=1 Tax=Anatilimnocola floriformis TaxID=2948575 RepID=UPI0020C44354|nr:Ig-like domain-containing protein [Anatilimnocola floriformis]
MSSTKRRAATARRQTTRRQFLQLEQLEERSVLAGNVTIMEAGGIVTMLGDNADNQVTVTLSGTNGAVITGQNGTTITNGLTGAKGSTQNVANFATFLNVNMLGGNDSLTFNGSTTQQLRVSSASLINLGEGNDTLRFNNFSAAGGLIVYGGGGDDTVEGLKSTDSTVNGGLRVNGVTVLNLGNGNDNLTLRNSAFNKSFVADGGLGNDKFDFTNNEFRNFTSISGSLGNDSFNNSGNTYTLPPFVTGMETTTTAQPPVAVADSATVAEGGSTVINVLTNDTAPVGSTIVPGSVAIVTQPTRGTVSVNTTTGAITYTHNGSETTSDSFTYRVTAANGAVSAPATVSLTVTPVNDAPVAVADAYTVNEGSTTTLNLAQNDTDVDSQLNLASIVITQQPTNGTVTVNNDGTVTYVANVGTATSDSFQYTIADQGVAPNGGAVSQPATVTITLTQVANAPTISAIDDLTTNEDTATAAIPFTVGDAETPVANLTVTAVSDNATLVPNNAANITLGGSGSARTIVITPAANQSGTATITVTVTDGDNQTATETFVVTVAPINDAPTITGAADITTLEDTATAAQTITVGDIETAAADLTVSATSSDVNVVANNGIAITGSGATRQVVVTPVANAFGTSTITLTVSDGTTTSQQTFVVTVTSVNDAPTLAAIDPVTVAVGTPIDPVNLSYSDVETLASDLVFSATSDNTDLITNAGLQFVGSGATRSLQITPEAGVTGSANITVRVTDAAGDFTEQIFTVVIDSPPTISAIADQTVTGTSVGPLPFTIGDTQTATADLTVSATSSNTDLVPVANIVFGGSEANRAVTVTPVSGVTGTSTITVTVTDASGLTASETFLVTVQAANTLPTITPDPIADINVDEDAPIASFVITVNDAETAGSALDVSATSSNTALIPNSGISISTTGNDRTVSITPTPDAFGTAIITIEVDDGNGGITSRSFTVNIASVNDAPVAGSTTVTVLEGSTTVIDLGALSSDVDSALNTASGIVVTPSATSHGTLNLNGDGTVTYVHDGSETTSDSFTYTIADIQGNVSAPATVNITITPVNDAPVAGDDENVVSFVVGSSIPVAVSGNVLTNDTDVDTAHALLAVSAQQSGTVGQEVQLTYGDLTINSDGSYTYTVDPALVDQIVTDVDEVFSYTVSDGDLTDIATLTIHLQFVTA